MISGVSMKKSWSPKWVGSSQPRKQRKYRHNAPLHIRRKFVSAHLSKELRKQFGKRSAPLRKGDEVTVVRGGFKGFSGNVERVDLKNSRIYIDGVKRKKVDGSEVSVHVHPSNVIVKKLSLEDKMRQKMFERAEMPKGERAPPKESERKQKIAPKKSKAKVSKPEEK